MPKSASDLAEDATSAVPQLRNGHQRVRDVLSGEGVVSITKLEDSLLAVGLQGPGTRSMCMGFPGSPLDRCNGGVPPLQKGG